MSPKAAGSDRPTGRTSPPDRRRASFGSHPVDEWSPACVRMSECPIFPEGLFMFTPLPCDRLAHASPDDDSTVGFDPRCEACLIPMTARAGRGNPHWACPACGRLRIS